MTERLEIGRYDRVSAGSISDFFTSGEMMLVTTWFQSTQSSLTLVSCVAHVIPATHTHKTQMFQPLTSFALVASTFWITTKFYNAFSWRVVSCLWGIVFISVRRALHYTPAALNSSKLFYFSVHHVLNILCKTKLQLPSTLTSLFLCHCQNAVMSNRAIKWQSTMGMHY